MNYTGTKYKAEFDRIGDIFGGIMSRMTILDGDDDCMCDNAHEEEYDEEVIEYRIDDIVNFIKKNNVGLIHISNVLQEKKKDKEDLKYITNTIEWVRKEFIKDIKKNRSEYHRKHSTVFKVISKLEDKHMGIRKRLGQILWYITPIGLTIYRRKDYRL